MKKFLFGFVSFLLLSCSFFVYQVKASEKSYYETLEEETFLEKAINPKIYDENTYYNDQKTYYNKYNIVVPGQNIKYIETKEDVYFLYYNGTYNILKYNTATKEKTSIIIYEEINDMIIYQDILYLVGCKNKDALLYLYNLDLTFNSIHTYGGSGYETFLKIAFINDQIYLFGHKNGISHQSPFTNSGNNTDIKAFIVMLDDDYIVSDGFYINEQHTKETFQDIIIKKEEIYFLINGDEQYYQYHLDQNFKVLEHFDLSKEFNGQKMSLLDSYQIDKEKVYLYVLSDGIYYGVFNNKVLHTYKIIANVTDYLMAKLNNGVMEIYYKLNDEVKKASLSMYYVSNLTTKTVTYRDITYLDTNHFQAASFFEELEFSYDPILNEKISLSNAGEYVAKYSAKRANGKEFVISTPYIVKSYLNVIDKGIYQKGYILEFTDLLYVNEKRVYPGEVLNETGEIHLKYVLSDKTYEYTIYVVDDYYKELTINHLDTDETLEINDNYQYVFNLSFYEKVKAVYVNNESYPFLQNNEQIIINLTSSKFNVDTYIINYLEFMDGTIYDLNQTIKIKTKKAPPRIDIYYQDQMVKYYLSDHDQTILDVMIKYYQNDQLIKVDKSYLKDLEISWVLPNTKIEIVLQYEVGTKEILEKTLFVLETKTIKKSSFKINFSFEDETLKEINLVDITSPKVKLEKLTSNETNLNASLVYNQNNLYFIVSCIITFFLVLVLMILVFSKKKKKRKKSKTKKNVRLKKA